METFKIIIFACFTLGFTFILSLVAVHLLPRDKTTTSRVKRLSERLESNDRAYIEAEDKLNNYGS